MSFITSTARKRSCCSGRRRRRRRLTLSRKPEIGNRKTGNWKTGNRKPENWKIVIQEETAVQFRFDRKTKKERKKLFDLLIFKIPNPFSNFLSNSLFFIFVIL
jgi:hypothetical protein